jgi:hypothetical protein
VKTLDYLYRYQGVAYSIDKIYRFLDTLCRKSQEESSQPEIKATVEKISFEHTKHVLHGNIKIFEGNIFEGHTFIPALEKIKKTHSLGKPIVVADAGLLSEQNRKSLEKSGYKYILGVSYYFTTIFFFSNSNSFFFLHIPPP